MSVYVFLANGFEEAEALVPIDLLRRASADVKLVSFMGKPEITGAHDITITADTYPSDVDITNSEAVIIPGGSGSTALLAKNSEAIKLIEQFAKAGKYICAICAAPSILGSMGLLDGRRATCYPSFSKYLNGAIYTGSDIEADDIFITAKAAGTAFDFGFEIVKILFGTEVSDRIKTDIFY